MKKLILLMVVVLGMNTFAMRDNGMDRDMRGIHIENQQNDMEMLSRESNITLEERSSAEKEQWIFENMTRKTGGSKRDR